VFLKLRSSNLVQKWQVVHFVFNVTPNKWHVTPSSMVLVLAGREVIQNLRTNIKLDFKSEIFRVEVYVLSVLHFVL